MSRSLESRVEVLEREAEPEAERVTFSLGPVGLGREEWARLEEEGRVVLLPEELRQRWTQELEEVASDE